MTSMLILASKFDLLRRPVFRLDERQCDGSLALEAKGCSEFGIAISLVSQPIEYRHHRSHWGHTDILLVGRRRVEKSPFILMRIPNQ